MFLDFSCFFLIICFAFGFLAPWLFGFLAFGLLGFSVSGLLGFSAFCWFMRLLVAFRILCIPSSSSVLAFAAFRWFMRLLAAFGGFGFSHPSGCLAVAPLHWFLDLASRIISITTTLFESSLRTSWGGNPPQPTRFCLHLDLSQLFFKHHGGGLPPPPSLLFRFLAEIELHPCLNHHFFERPISRENAPKYDILGNLYVCSSSNNRGSHPRQPSRCLLNSTHPFLNHCIP